MVDQAVSDLSSSDDSRYTLNLHLSQLALLNNSMFGKFKPVLQKFLTLILSQTDNFDSAVQSIVSDTEKIVQSIFNSQETIYE